MTLPLSYSRQFSRSNSVPLPSAFALRATADNLRLSLARQPKLARRLCERRLVAREGLEPSKPLGRQIYSLLRLTASLPRQLLLFGNVMLLVLPKDRMHSVDGAGEGIRTPDLLITNQLLYRTELRQPDKR